MPKRRRVEGHPFDCGFCCTNTKGRSIAEKPKRPPGRPRTGITPLTGLRIPAELNAKLDAWIERQPDPKPSRSEAIRRLLERALEQGS
jgi:hypothetical protein